MASTGDTTNSYCCGNTDDKIFLLSVKEVETSGYRFSSNNDRIRKTTDYAKANYAYQSNTDGCGGWWWLRSPYYNPYFTARAVYIDGDYIYCVIDRNGGVVPALSISFE